MQRQLPAIGMAMMIVGASCLATKDGFAKMLVQAHHPIVVMWLQYFIIWIAVAPLVAYKHGLPALLPKPYGLQFARGFFSMSTVIFFFFAIQYIQLAEAHAMVFIGPLLATALSPFILKERVGIHRITAVLIGFSGVLIILRPDFSAASFGHVIAMGAGFSIAGYFLTNKKAAGSAPPAASVAHSVIVGTLLLLPIIPSLWVMPHSSELTQFGAFFIFSIAGQALLVISFNFGPTSIIAPFHYTQIIMSVVFGWLAFNQIPDIVTMMGIAVVIGSGVYIALREGRAQQEPVAQTAPRG